MQNILQKFKQSSIVFKKPGILSENLKSWKAPTILQFNIFWWNFACIFYLPISSKAFVGFFKFHLDLELFTKNFYTLLFYTFIKNSRSKQKKQNSPNNLISKKIQFLIAHVSHLNVSWRSVGPRTDPWGTPALTEYSCEDLQSRTNEKKGQISDLEFHKFFKKTSMQNYQKPWIYQVLPLE